jgi:hypothetical protein
MALQEKLSLLKDLLQHMGDCCEEWQDADDHRHWVFADSLRRDLTEFCRLCDSVLSERRDHSPAVWALC